MRKPLLPLLLLLLLASAALIVCPLLGMQFIPLSADGLEREILVSLRVPRVICAFAAGALLSDLRCGVWGSGGAGGWAGAGRGGGGRAAGARGARLGPPGRVASAAAAG